ncbi:unnamed protein product, partial [Hapterophycus canaliculatus]
GSHNAGGRSQLPLSQVVARRAFECVVGAQGGLSKVFDVGRNHNSKRSEGHGTQTEPEKAMNQRELNLPHGRPRSPEVSVQLVPYGADIDVSGKESSEGFWGVDLHMIGLGSLVGLPVERGASPWASDAGRNDSYLTRTLPVSQDIKRLWRCVYLDVSLNRLRRITAIVDQPCLRDLAYLDVSHNLIEDLDTVQGLHSLQAGRYPTMIPQILCSFSPLYLHVLLASNNRISSLRALGEHLHRDIFSSAASSSPPPSSCSSIRRVDLSNNSIAVVAAPLSAQTFRLMKSLRLASNRLECFEEDAAQALTSLERLDVSADNELVSIDWVALLESLRFLDCSENRITAVPAFARALATPPRLEEVIAEGNPVVQEPRYRITVLMKCKKILRLDHRPVDGAALRRQLDLATQTKALHSVRETAND